MESRGRCLAGLAVAAVLLLGFTACGGLTLRNVGDDDTRNQIGEGLGYVTPNRPYSVGEMMICLSEPGAAEITGVRPWHPIGEVIVQAFAVRPNPFMFNPSREALGDAAGTLREQGFHASHVVKEVCNDKTGSAAELGLQLTRRDTRDVGAAGWVVSYRAGGNTGELVVPLQVELCSGKGWSAGCTALDKELSQHD